MNTPDKFKAFISSLHESVNNDTDKKLLEAVNEAYTLLEGNPYIWNNPGSGPVTRRGGSSGPKQTEEEIGTRNAERNRSEKLANQAGGRLKGVKTQLIKAAKAFPLEIEEFIRNGEILGAIKEGKAQLDQTFGTETGKRSLKDRFKGAFRGFTESIEDGSSFTDIGKSMISTYTKECQAEISEAKKVVSAIEDVEMNNQLPPELKQHIAEIFNLFDEGVTDMNETLHQVVDALGKAGMKEVSFMRIPTNK